MRYFTFLLSSLLIFISCSSDEPSSDSLLDIVYNPVAYELKIPDHFPTMIIPEDNPLTVDGVTLGRHLFYDPLLSSDNSMSCSSCHLPEGNFTDNLAVSPGVTGQVGERSSMSLLNIGFNNNGFFWDGRVPTLEEQALLPVEDPIELHDMWPSVVEELKVHEDYPAMFRKAFGISDTSEITRTLVVKAIAQFERTLVSSGNSKYDRVIAGTEVFTDEELLGHNIFFDIDPDVSRHAECGHCHNAPLFTTNEYFNNGLDDVDGGQISDLGLGGVTLIDTDNGKFRVPSLRNVLISAPFMHDGRFLTIEEVIDHYDQNVIPSRNVDPNLRILNLSQGDRAALLAFIRTLEDPDFTQNPDFQSPF